MSYGLCQPVGALPDRVSQTVPGRTVVPSDP